MKRSITTQQPKLSLVYIGRNDGYMGNFNWRLSTTLNYLSQNLLQLGRLGDVEVLVTDWGSEVPLHAALSLSLATKHIVKFLIVPPDLANQVQDDSDFGIVLAQNAGIRRSHGEFIGQVDSDMMLSVESLAGLWDVLDQRRDIGSRPDQSLIYTKRRHVPWRYVAECPPIHELDWFIHQWGRLLPVERFFGFEFAGPGFLIMHRRLWEECRGYDERLLYRGWMEIDLGLRVRRRYPLVNLQKFGITAFHLEHFPARNGNHLNRKQNPTNWNNDFCPNDEDWGLGRYTLSVFTYPLQSLDLGSPVSPQPIRLSTNLAKQISLVILNGLGFPFQFAIGRTMLITRRVFFHLGHIQKQMKGLPPEQWPGIVKEWWIERKKRI